jgi:RNA-binding protein YhbY
VDLKAYFRKIRDAEKGLKGEYQLVVSMQTPDGGRAGVITEVATAIASRLIVEAKARRATDEETKRFYEEMAAQRKAVAKQVLASAVQSQLARLMDAWLGKGAPSASEEAEPAAGEDVKK